MFISWLSLTMVTSEAADNELTEQFSLSSDMCSLPRMQPSPVSEKGYGLGKLRALGNFYLFTPSGELYSFYSIELAGKF